MILVGSKTTIAGEIKEIRIMKNPNNKDLEWHCLEIITGGSDNAPKGLPTASKDVQYTCLLNTKQFNKLKKRSG